MPPAGTSWPTSSGLGSGCGSTAPSLLQCFAFQPCRGLLNCRPDRTGGAVTSVTCSQRHRGGRSPILLPRFPPPACYHASGFCGAGASAHPPAPCGGPPELCDSRVVQGGPLVTWILKTSGWAKALGSQVSGSLWRWLEVQKGGGSSVTVLGLWVERFIVVEARRRCWSCTWIITP